MTEKSENFIVEKIGEAARWEQLAEECAELGHAALKVARILRGENPAPVNLRYAKANAIEEAADVLVAESALFDRGLKSDIIKKIAEEKLQRWEQRIVAAESENKLKGV